MKQSVIPTMEDIRARADIPVFEVAGALEPMTGPVQVGSNDIYSVLKFADAVGSRALMVQYDYPEFDDFYVDPGAYPLEEMFEEECMDEVYEAIRFVENIPEGNFWVRSKWVRPTKKTTTRLIKCG